MKAFTRYRWAFVTCVVLLIFDSTNIKGQTSSPETDNEVVSVETDEKSETDQQDQPAADREQEKKEAQTVGMMLIVLIIFLGACSILFAMFWGYRVRRLLRSRKSSPTQLDEFWYLRPPQEQVTTSGLEDNSESDDEQHHPEQ